MLSLNAKVTGCLIVFIECATRQGEVTAEHWQGVFVSSVQDQKMGILQVGLCDLVMSSSL